MSVATHIRCLITHSHCVDRPADRRIPIQQFSRREIKRSQTMTPLALEFRKDAAHQQTSIRHRQGMHRAVAARFPGGGRPRRHIERCQGGPVNPHQTKRTAAQDLAVDFTEGEDPARGVQIEIAHDRRCVRGDSRQPKP